MHWSHVKEIPKTSLLISLDHCFFDYAKFEIFNIEKRKRIYKSKEIRGGIYSSLFYKIRIFNQCIEVGYGDISYNANRNFAALIPVVSRTHYHLFDCSRLKVVSKPKWQPFHLSMSLKNYAKPLTLLPTKRISQAWISILKEIKS